MRKSILAIMMSLIMLLSSSSHVLANDNKYLVNYLNEEGVVEKTKTYSSNEDVDLSVKLGGKSDVIGWSLTKDGSKLNSLKMENKDITLYPIVSHTGYYKVIYEVNGEVKESYNVKGNTGDKILTSNLNKKTYPGYIFDENSSTKEITIEKDKVNEIILKYTLKQYTINFNIKGNYREVSDLYYSSLSMNINGNTYTDTYSVNVNMKDNLSSIIPTNNLSSIIPTKDNVVNNEYLTRQYSDYFKGWSDNKGNIYKDVNTLINALPYIDDNNVITLNGYWEANNVSGTTVSIKFNIYLENVNQDGYDKIETIEKEAVANEVSKIIIDNYNGYTYVRSETVGEKLSVDGPYWYSPKVEYYGEYNVYFNRNSYTLTLKVNNEIVKEEEIVYGKSLTYLKDYKPYLNERGYLDGWYDNDNIAFDFNTTMSSDLTLNATLSYNPLQTKTITYNNDGKLSYVTVSKDAIIRINDGTLFTKEGYTFDHFNTLSDDSGTSYKANELLDVNDDITLYVIYKSNKVNDVVKTKKNNVKKVNKKIVKTYDNTHILSLIVCFVLSIVILTKLKEAVMK